GFSFVHTFTNEQLDQLIQQICFSEMLSTDEKSELIERIISTASVNYRTPFWDGKELKFNPKGIHSRFSGRKQRDRALFAENLKVIQYAINHFAQIRFRFNRYTDEKKIIPTSEYTHTLSPYHLVIYHDNYYCIGLKADDKRIWHYRVDLMSDIEIVTDEEGKIIPIEIGDFEGLPICNMNWNPEKYMAEHLNMGYDEPQDIRIKIKNTDYTIIHDWFGDHYEKVREVSERDENGRDVMYDIVRVYTSPSMIVHWAMQYGTRVEIMDEEIREKIREEIKSMEEKYGKTGI
ncbi:MAG: WYL domain-containing protein, partial [Lachnospiraceae bacterium]|nr:WYL domain-containing protein [Lachnospiraceae bacterium]